MIDGYFSGYGTCHFNRNGKDRYSEGIVFVDRLVVKLLTASLERLLRRSKVEETLISFFSSLAYFTLSPIVVMVALGVLGIPMTSMVAVLGASVLAIGIALQDSIANLAAGVLVLGLHPYQLGDVVEGDGVSGYVKEIGFFHSTFTTRDINTEYLPSKSVIAG